MEEVFNEVMWAVLCDKCGELTESPDGTVGLFPTEEIALQQVKSMTNPSHPPKLIKVQVVGTRVIDA